MDHGELDDRNFRVSDTERAHARQLLEHAVGQGMLTLDEFEERVDAVFAARTRGELSGVVADLPGLQLANRQPSSPAAPEVLRGRMSSISRKGRWTVPSALRLDTRMCDTTLDFSSANLQSPVVELVIDDYCSSTELIVPDQATADLNGVDTFAGSATLKVGTNPRPDRLHLVVRGRVRFGSLTVRHAYGKWWRHMMGEA